MDLLKTVTQHLPELSTKTEILSNITSAKGNRCQNELIDGKCSRIMHLIDGEEICFYCQDIEEQYRKVAEEVKVNHINKPLSQLMKYFEDKSLMNEDLKPCTIKGYVPVTESQKVARETAVEYIKNFDGRSGLLFFGNPGSGKSHLLSGIVKGIIGQHGKSAIFISLPRLLSELKATFGKKDKNEMDILMALYAVDLLVIDEIGGERTDANDEGTPWAKKKLNEIVDARAGKATCYSSNYDFEQLLNLYGERDFSRIVQYAEPIQVNGPNDRLKRFQK